MLRQEIFVETAEKFFDMSALTRMRYRLQPYAIPAAAVPLRGTRE